MEGRGKVASDDGKGPDSQEDSDYSSDDHSCHSLEGMENEGENGRIRDSQTDPLYLSSHTFADFGKQVQLFDAAPDDEPFGLLQSVGSDDEGLEATDQQQKVAFTDKQSKNREPYGAGSDGEPSLEAPATSRHAQH
jgi:hypothetical protein